MRPGKAANKILCSECVYVYIYHPEKRIAMEVEVEQQRFFRSMKSEWKVNEN